MSINVTVTGNPVSVKRGSMVTGYDPTKTEFEKRRLIRLEQVRQQSKDIAQGVRNKIRHEKAKCASELEKEGERKLKKWQARKLLELQNQYQDALEEIGVGHKEAQLVAEDEEELMLLEAQESTVARERGRVAASRLQIARNEASLRKAVPVQRKNMAREEAVAASRNKTRKKKGRSSSHQLFDSDGENRVPQLSLSSASVEATQVRNSPRKVSKEQQTSQVQLEVSKRDKSAQTLFEEGVGPNGGAKNVPLDTRITEHIKRRMLYNQHLDYCDLADKELPLTSLNRGRCSCCRCPQREPPLTHSTYYPQDQTKSSPTLGPEHYQQPPPPPTQVEEPKQSATKIDSVLLPKEPTTTVPEPSTTSQRTKSQQKPKEDTKQMKNKPIDIPSKPKITLKSSKERTPVTASYPKPVQYYDHPNRFTKHYLPKSSAVEKIDVEHLDISPNLVSEEEVRRKLHQRDVEAQLRGQAALEKERVQREYRELLKKLPVLQKRERIFEIGADKEKYHMARDRLEELERRRQNRLDNAYEEVFVRQRKPAMVTLSKRKTEDDEMPSLNLGTWNVDVPLPKSSHDRADQLNSLLVNLKAHKDSLIREIEHTLSGGEGSSSVRSTSKDDTVVNRKKRSRDVTEAESKSRLSSKKGTPASTGVSPSPRKKAKLKSKQRKVVVVLQNTSTQTTPKMEQQSVATSPLTLDTDTIMDKTSTDDLCEILITIKEDERPEVTVNPPLMGVKVVAEEKKMEQLQSDRGSKKSTTSKRWKDSLTSTRSTTSTSYLEPPKTTSRRSPGELEEIWKNTSFPDGSSSKTMDPRLLTYIKKLLKMSRASIDDLAVSAASDISTPGDSVVDTPSNNPLLQLKNVMRYFNLDSAELQKHLTSTSEGGNSMHHNTSDSVTIITTTTTTSSEEVQFKSCTEVQQHENQKSETEGLMEYADIAASCTQKISSLTAMIEKVREEKKKILESSSGSDKDMTTTSYMNLPQKGDSSTPTSSSSSSSQEDLGDKLITIDYSYAEKLKHLTTEQIEEEKKKIQARDEELVTKLTQVLQDGATTTESPPLFLDIPKLPRLGAPSLGHDQQQEERKKKRPPPSKGLRILGGPVPLVPHELSTIIEADSQVSTTTKVESSPTTKTIVPDILTAVPGRHTTLNTNSSDEVSEMETMETMLISIGMEWAIPTLKKTREALALSTSSSSGSKKESGEVSLREFLNKISTSTSTSSNSVLSDSQGVSLIQVDCRRTSTPIQEQQAKKEGAPVFLTDSDLSSVKEHSNDGSKT